MNDTSADAAEPPPPASAGGLLRQARLARGLHIAALATSIKVAPRKLELLEADRYEELPGATFTRALAQTVCRTLKIDSAPVLALLPQPLDRGLSQLSMGLNEPFRDKPGRRVPNDLSFLKSPIVISAAVLIAASAALYLIPAGWIFELTRQVSDSSIEGNSAQAPSAAASVVMSLPPPEVVSLPSDATVPDPAASAAIGGVFAAPAASSVAVVPAPMPPMPSGALLLRAQEKSWVEVIDGRGNSLMSRLLEAGEAVALDGPTPLRVRIGNASATQVSFRGRPVELVVSRDNVAKLELR